MRVGVVTVGVSTGAYFPAWCAYYGELFGSENLHVFTEVESKEKFEAFDLGGIHVLAEGFDEDVRKEAITRFVANLLDTHDCVIRVDVDEFIVVDRTKFPSLSAYLAGWNGSHLTAQGFDVIQSLDEPEIDFSTKFMKQRRFAYALTAMNKTCITRVPLKWNRGFHFCTLPPSFGGIYLFHLKRADINSQADWNAKMRPRVATDHSASRHYSWELDKILQYHKYRFTMPLVDGPDSICRTAFNQNFLEKIRFSKHSKIFDGPYVIEDVNIEIPDSFRDFF